ncbi:MAG: RidA family protein [Stappiaceae bacterium]
MTSAEHGKQTSAAGYEINIADVVRNLPAPEGTKYAYDLVTIEGRTAYLAGQIPKQNGTLAYVGPVGRELREQDAVAAARICSQQALAWLNFSAGGLGNLNRILRITCYVAHDDTFSDISAVADGASKYLIDALADRGRHSRTVVGVKSLPRNAPVLVELTASLREPVH